MVKAFEKVWYDGILFKLKLYDVEGELFSLQESSLKNRERRVVQNCQTLYCKGILSSVPEGLVLSPL